MRSFKLDSECDENGEETLKSEIRREMVTKLASEWNECQQKLEQRSWRSEEDSWEEADYHAQLAGDAADEAEEKAQGGAVHPNLTKDEIEAIRQKAEDEYYAEVKKRESVDTERMGVIEELLGELGARMMRPYEHWNEDERYMEYMETRHDNDY